MLQALIMFTLKEDVTILLVSLFLFNVFNSIISGHKVLMAMEMWIMNWEVSGRK
jgi:hypothetical protein